MTDNNDGLSGILSAVLAQGQTIQAADDVIDNKSNNLMGAALVVITILAVELKSPDGQLQVLNALAIIVSVAVIGLVLYMTRTQDYYGSVVDLKRHKEYFSKPSGQLLAQLIEDARFANKHNEYILGRKQHLFRIALALFLTGFVVGLGALFINA